MVIYLRAENLAKRYGERVLFENLTLSIAKGNKVALIAQNGSGKTNLLNILAGTDQSDGNGKVIIDKNIHLAYLPQEPHFNHAETVWDAIFEGKNPALKAIAKYEEWVEKTAENADDFALQQLQSAIEEIDRLQAWDYENKVKLILTKLNITRFNQPIHELSGGQKKRLALAGLLVHTPDFIIMDEPTNHLDVDMIEWLEGYLKSNDVTLLLVTHDRYFLDAVCNEIIELNEGKLYSYKGNYAYYIEKKAERELQLEAEIDKAKNLYRKELEWMRRQPQARGTKQKARINAFYETEQVAKQKISNEKVELSIKMSRLGNKIIELEHISKRFGELNIINDFSYTFKPGERIGIVGKNGVGKSTFLNILQGIETVDSGRVIQGDTLKFGYYAQTGLPLKEDKRVLELVEDIAEYIEVGKGEKLTARQLCKRFLFDDKKQYNYVSKLSGGEKRRLFLLTILLQNPNFLILDEPTNDLDIPTLNVLEEFLELYKGCLLVVTHDRYFMDKLADHLFIFEGNGVIRDFNGNYQDYLNEKEELKIKESKPKQEAAIKPLEQAVAVNAENKRKLSYKEQRELDEINTQIPLLENKKKSLEQQLSAITSNHEELIKIGEELSEINEKLERLELRWLELSE